MDQLFVKQEALKNLPQIDAILLDIDGVVLDVSQSFRTVCSEVTQWYAVHVLKLQNEGVFFDARETELFKNAGGFNNDWDLTNAAVALLCAKHAKYPNLDTVSLRQQSPNLLEYTTEIKRRGGGLAVAESFLLELLTPTERREFALKWNARQVTQLCQEMYAGETNCRRLYGFTPEYVHGEGYLDKEPVLLDAKLLPPKAKVGVLTGRTLSETQIALERAGLAETIDRNSLVTDDDGVRKPDGRALGLLQERMKFRNGIYIGDTIDDLRVVQNFRETNAGGRARIFSCLVLSGPAGNANQRAFLEAGTEVVGPDVNSVLQYLNGVLR